MPDNMFKNLKTSEKILLCVLVVAVVFYLFVSVLMPKYAQANTLQSEIETLEAQINTLNNKNSIDANGNGTSEEKELNNKLLTYKNDYFIENFTQDYIILKLNDFLGENTSETDGFSIKGITFSRLSDVESAEPEVEKADTAEKTDSSDEDTKDSATNEKDTKETEDTEKKEETPADTEPAKVNDDGTIESNPEEEKKQEEEEEKANTFNVSEIDTSTINKDAFDYYYAKVDFVSNFDGLTNYVKNLESFSKSILITSISITPVVENTIVNEDSEEEQSTSGYQYIASNGYIKDVPDEFFKEKGTVNGTIELVFVNFKVYHNEEELEYTNPIFENNESDMIKVENPFRAYDNFTYFVEPEPDTSFDDGYLSGNGGSLNLEPENRLIYRTIYGFENKQFFFSSTPNSTKGTAQLSPLAYGGSKSGKLTYNFTKGVETNTASYVFDSNSVLVSEKPYSIGLKVYELTEMPYNLGITIKDSSGKSYDLILQKNVDADSSWVTYQATELPALTYPCIVKRVFVTTEGLEKTQLQGELLLDNLEVSKEVK